ncbi:hypothetical protein IWW37_003863 [Coemansia sp. RSA 2050]|nr:hypothetical protein IWW37_003863 [Coemansia sp. RSA 2050]
MPQPSPLQFLLPHAVKPIVDHVVGSNRLAYDGVRAMSFVFVEDYVEGEDDDDDIVVGLARTEANTRAFVQRIRQIAPLVSEIIVVLSDYNGTPTLVNLKLDGKSTSMLRKYQVFAPGGHPKLQAVQLCLRGNFGSESLASPAEAMQFVHNINSGAAVQEYSGQVKVGILLPLDDHA